MACTSLSKGRKLPCRGGNGGLKAVGFAVWDSNDLVESADGVVSGITTGITAIYRYELKNAGNNYSEEIASDPEARTVVYNGTLSLVLQKLDIDTRNEIKMLALGEVIIFLEHNNGDIYLVGAEFGAQLTGGTFVTGGARVDMAGSNLTFTTSENEPYLTLDASAKADYATKVVEGE